MYNFHSKSAPKKKNMNATGCIMMSKDVRSSAFQMLYLCIVFERPKLRVRVLTIFSTCTSKISYVYPQPGKYADSYRYVMKG